MPPTCRPPHQTQASVLCPSKFDRGRPTNHGVPFLASILPFSAFGPSAPLTRTSSSAVALHSPATNDTPSSPPFTSVLSLSLARACFAPPALLARISHSPTLSVWLDLLVPRTPPLSACASCVYALASSALGDDPLVVSLASQRGNALALTGMKKGSFIDVTCPPRPAPRVPRVPDAHICITRTPMHAARAHPRRQRPPLRARAERLLVSVTRTRNAAVHRKYLSPPALVPFSCAAPPAPPSFPPRVACSFPPSLSSKHIPTPPR
ncbi:hypothetical protein B0H16DRAFT_1716553 [Mycena metata]|uniref:Uncharacterized protein n=1 Tax=Mycena metata TaxID=1033252 RepID=A0AAD7JM95_9AGAR|nr:hypothetical protein B0H16DRAFT_1716553 [Mycena metata]